MAKLTPTDMGWSQTPAAFIRYLFSLLGELENTLKQSNCDRERTIEALIWLCWRLSFSTYNETLDPGRARDVVTDKSKELDWSMRTLLNTAPAEGPRTKYRIRVLLIFAYMVKSIGRYESAEEIFKNIPDMKSLLEMLQAESVDDWLKTKREEAGLEHFLLGGKEAARALAECFKESGQSDWVAQFGLKCLAVP
ncbi:hypothetical protein JNK13_08485 [bacterium]|nr:hypothetical protein [bacterium]